MRRMPLAILATAVGVLGAASAASAAGPVQDGQFNLQFSSGKIVIADLAHRSCADHGDDLAEQAL